MEIHGGSSVDSTDTFFFFFPALYSKNNLAVRIPFFFFLRFVSLRLVTNLSKRDNAYRVYNYLTKRGTKKKERKKKKRGKKSQVHDTVSVYKERFINETGLFRETHEQTAISRFIEK